MHGLASLMAAASEFADWDPTSSGVSTPAGRALVSPTPAPTVHFPSSITSSGPGSSTGATSAIQSPQTRPVVPPRRQRVSFHSPAPPSEPTFGTTAETAVASTANSASRTRQTSNRFSITGLSGVLGLSRSPTTSEALANLELLAEANDLPPRQANNMRGSHSPLRPRVESSPMLSDLPTSKLNEEWSRGWTRGEGPSAADALEEFGAVMRSHENDRKGSATSSSQVRRPRGGSLGCDSRLFVDDPCEEEYKPVQWGVDVEGVRLGEVSSLTGEGELHLAMDIADNRRRTSLPLHRDGPRCTQGQDRAGANIAPQGQRHAHGCVEAQRQQTAEGAVRVLRLSDARDDDDVANIEHLPLSSACWPRWPHPLPPHPSFPLAFATRTHYTTRHDDYYASLRQRHIQALSLHITLCPAIGTAAQIASLPPLCVTFVSNAKHPHYTTV